MHTTHHVFVSKTIHDDDVAQKSRFVITPHMSPKGVGTNGKYVTGIGSVQAVIRNAEALPVTGLVNLSMHVKQ